MNLVKPNSMLDLMQKFYINMFYDIIQRESVDEHGNTTVELLPLTVAPVYDDLKPSDMSLENQQKAGVKLERVRQKSKPNLESSDIAEASIIRNGESVVLPEPSFEPSSEPTSEPNPEPKSE